MQSLCTNFELLIIQYRETEFLYDYLAVLKSVAKALDKLQGEENSYTKQFER